MSDSGLGGQGTHSIDRRQNTIHINLKGKLHHFPEPCTRFSFSYPWGIYYLWEKYGLGNPAPSPPKCAEVTLDLLYNCFILSSKALELTSD